MLVSLNTLSSRSTGEDDDRGPSLVLTGVLLLTAAALVVSARVYCRVVLVKRMGLDDWCMIFAAVVATPIVVLNCISVAGGVGRHTWTTNFRGEQQAIKLGWISMMHYFVSLGLTKASLLLFLIRLGPGTPLYYTSWCVLVFVTLYTLIAFVLSTIQCMPAAYMWHSVATGRCLDRKTIGLVLYSISITTDFIIWVIPMKKVLRLRVPKEQKAALVGVFSLGSLSVLAGIMRLKSVINSFTTKDPMYDNVDLGIWSLTEVLVGIMCGSAPAIKPLFAKYLPEFRSNPEITVPAINNPRGPRALHSWGATALGSFGGTEEGASTEGFRGSAEAESVDVDMELDVIDIEIVGKGRQVDLV